MNTKCDGCIHKRGEICTASNKCSDGSERMTAGQAWDEMARLRAENEELTRTVRVLQTEYVRQTPWVDPQEEIDELRAEVERLNELDKRRCEEIQRLRASGAQSLNDWQNIRAEIERLRMALEGLVRAGRKQGFNDRYPCEMADARAVLGEGGKEPETCVWQSKKSDAMSSTSCGRNTAMVALSDDGEDMQYCCFCGKRVEVRG